MAMIDQDVGDLWRRPRQSARGGRPRRASAHGSGMGIKELAERLGTTHRALRYYEQVELIQPARTPQGARNYEPETRRELELIVTLRRTGHSVREIRAILKGEDIGDDDGLRSKVFAALQARLDHLHEQTRHLQALLNQFR
jgi:DNA-binding transcriptional MerR regulator